MGWLFGRKKKIPFPEPQMIDEEELKFPVRPSSQKVIKADEFKEAAGLKMPNSKEDDFDMEMSQLPKPSRKEMLRPPQEEFASFPPEENLEGPLYIKLHVYQRIIAELDAANHDLTELQHINKKLETSEYNEDNNFSKLRREIKAVHDYLLQADKTLFNM